MMNGDKVAYSRKFLQSIGAFTGPMPFRRGVILDVVDDPFVIVQWNDIPQSKLVNKNNLVLVDRMHLEPV